MYLLAQPYLLMSPSSFLSIHHATVMSAQPHTL
jgi:hypothetical protein